MRLLLTRPLSEAQSSAQKLQAVGFSVVCCPVMEVRPLPVAWPQTPQAQVPQAQTPQALVATSANAFLQPVPDSYRRLPVFCVGQATAAAAREAGLRDCRIGAGSAAELVPVIAASGLQDLLYLAARHRKPDLETALPMRVIETYEAALRDSLTQPEWDQIAACTHVLHYSRRSAAHYLALGARHDRLEIAQAQIHLCLSADVAAPLREQGMKIRVASQPNEAGLFAAIGS